MTSTNCFPGATEETMCFPDQRDDVRDLMTPVYSDLRARAGQAMRNERPDHTLQPTALANEAILRLCGDGANRMQWKNREHFLAVATRAMRRILIDHARTRGRVKRGGDRRRAALEDDMVSVHLTAPEDLIALHEALERLAAVHPRQARHIELRFFAGLTNQEIAAVTNTPVRTVQADWGQAQAWLRRELGDGDEASDG